jgi:hypothetical protein
MLVLQQHNCLNVNLPHEVDVEEDTLAIATDRLKMKGLIYSINFDFILHRYDILESYLSKYIFESICEVRIISLKKSDIYG